MNQNPHIKVEKTLRRLNKERPGNFFADAGGGAGDDESEIVDGR